MISAHARGALVLIVGCSEPRVAVDPSDVELPFVDDATLDMRLDADDGQVHCSLGTAAHSAAVADASLFGEPVHFAEGGALPAGRYLVEYVDGCIKYAPGQWWAIHAHADGSAAFWLIGDGPSDRKLLLPGTVGYLPGTAGPAPARDGFERFGDCTAANARLPPLEFDHAGGPLALWLSDTNYPDNLSGEGGRNPTWRLTLLGECMASEPP